MQTACSRANKCVDITCAQAGMQLISKHLQVRIPGTACELHTKEGKPVSGALHQVSYFLKMVATEQKQLTPGL